MRLFLVSALLGLFLFGCKAQDSLDLQPFIHSWPTIGPEYRASLEGTWPGANLTATDLEVRKMLCDELDAITKRRGE
jgi:hypothetical protein